MAIAQAHGIEVTQPLLLRSTNNTVVRLPPRPLVAKVSDRLDNRLAFELEVGQLLKRAGAPVGVPDPDLGAQVHEHRGHFVTFWRYLEPDAQPGAETALADALSHFHQRARALEKLGGIPLPPFDQGASDVRRRLDDPAFAQALTSDERSLLRRTLDASDLASEGEGFVLHGSPHGYNIVWVRGDPIFVDLESACAGPIEWDLAHLDPLIAAAYPRKINPDLLATCRTAIAACTAAWCMDGIDRGPDMEWHARAHLASVSRWEGRNPR